MLLAANLAVEPPAGVETVSTPTAESMLEAALALGPVDVSLLAAAVADYRPSSPLAGQAHQSATSPGRSSSRRPSDIARRLGKRKRDGRAAGRLRRRPRRAGARAQACNARGQERRPRGLQRPLATRHRLRGGRQRGGARLRGSARRQVAKAPKAGDRRRDPRRGRAAWRRGERGLRPLPGGPQPPAQRSERPGDRAARAGEVAPAREGLDPGGARDRLLRIRRFVEAERSSEPLLEEIHPTDHYAHYALGRVLEKQGRAAEANGHYKLASSMNPGNEGYAARTTAG